MLTRFPIVSIYILTKWRFVKYNDTCQASDIRQKLYKSIKHLVKHIITVHSRSKTVSLKEWADCNSWIIIQYGGIGKSNLMYLGTKIWILITEIWTKVYIFVTYEVEFETFTFTYVLISSRSISISYNYSAN